LNYTTNEVLQYVEENDVKFIRLAFCDIFGIQKNISIMSSELPRAFENGISFNASAVKGFMNVEESNLLLHPDPSTLAVLPWRPQQGRVARLFCDIRDANGESFEGDGRQILKNAVERAKRMGYTCDIGSECEFYIFRLDEEGNPTKIPSDRAGYFDIAPRDKCENVRRDICLTLEQMGMQPKSSHHEKGPGQNEINFAYSDPLSAADNLTTFKAVVKTVATQNGFYASFMPKPLKEKNGSGLHINLALKKDKSIFYQEQDENAAEAGAFIAGIMEKMPEMTLFMNPITNSYNRLGTFEAPKYITWSHENHSQLVMIPTGEGHGNATMELRSADPSCNPYLTYALLIHAGLDGIENQTKLGMPLDLKVHLAGEDELAGLKSLPENMEQAIVKASGSAFIKSAIPGKMSEKFIEAKKEECDRYKRAGSKELFEQEEYFEIL